LNQIAIHIFA